MSAIDTPAAHEMELASGVYLNLTEIDAHRFTLTEVAWGLAHVTRFTGQACRSYYVAEHAMLVAARLRHVGAPPVIQLGGLHHDDAEAFLGDVGRPLKSLLPDYEALEWYMQRAIMASLGLPPHVCNAPIVKDADTWALSAEAHFLMPSQGRGWHCDGVYNHHNEEERTLAQSVIFRGGNTYHAFMFEHGLIAKEIA